MENGPLMAIHPLYPCPSYLTQRNLCERDSEMDDWTISFPFHGSQAAFAKKDWQILPTENAFPNTYSRENTQFKRSVKQE